MLEPPDQNARYGVFLMEVEVSGGNASFGAPSSTERPTPSHSSVVLLK